MGAERGATGVLGLPLLAAGPARGVFGLAFRDRRHGVAGAYEKLKAVSRGKRLDRKQLADFVRRLPIPAAEKKRLLALTPASYTGLAAKLAKRI